MNEDILMIQEETAAQLEAARQLLTEVDFPVSMRLQQLDAEFAEKEAQGRQERAALKANKGDSAALVDCIACRILPGGADTQHSVPP
jgi:hypothetical protein